MKMKYLNKIFTWVPALALLTAVGCVESEDLVTENAKGGGALLSINGTEGKLLGIEDPDTEEVSFTDNDLVFNAQLVVGQFKDETFTLVKQFNGQEVEIEDFSTLPFEYEIASLDDFLEGFTGVTPEDLRIGDAITYQVKIHTADGRTLYSNDAKYTVVVNCGSDLAATYTMEGLYQRPASGIVDSPVGPKDDEVSKVGVNQYGTTYTGHWNPSVDLGVPTCPVIFSVQCGIITIPEQYLCDAYSNLVSGTGYVDEVTGDMYFEYQITGGNLRNYTFTYTKQ